MTEMVEAVIDSIRVNLMSSQRVVILRQRDVLKYLPIWVGPFEADSITVALQEVEVSRPLTHDLMKNVFNLLGARVLRVEVVALREDTFYGNIVFELDDRTLDLDARPSDAIALAVRLHVPILVSQEVMDAAGILPEQDLRTAGDTAPAQPEEPAANAPEEPGLPEEKRLNIFEDFLKKLGDQPGEDHPEG